MQDLTLEHMLDLLEDRIVTTSKGRYIAIDDLQQLKKDFKEAKELQEPSGKAKTLLGARKALKEDPEFLKEFEAHMPKAPADAGVVKPVAEGARNEAA